MDKLIRHIEKRIEIGKRPYSKGTTGYNNLLDLRRYDEFIVQDVLRLYTSGQLQQMDQLQQRQTWRSVADDPPDADIDVLLLFRYNLAVGGWFTTDDHRIRWYVNSDDGYYTTTDSVPLCWMPLPDEPEKED